MNRDQAAQDIIAESQRRGHRRDETIAEVATAIQESSLNPDAVSPNGQWVGLFQQDGSYPGRWTAEGQIAGFMDRLDVKRASPGASTDPWLNIFWLQQRPGEPTAAAAYANGRQAYLSEIKSRATDAARLVDTYSSTGAMPVTDRPDFNEFPRWSLNNQSRSGTKVDLFLLHTQEGGGGDSAAEDLANYLGNPANQVSYHYAIGQASDGGVTVVDVVDTDLASWSVLSANNRSINLCFAGSRAAWTREQWLQQAHAIDVAAYLAVEDCRKYRIPIKVIPPPYGPPGGISDHAYVTRYLHDGTHTDVGPNFPWDVFTAAVNKYAGNTPETPVTPAPTPPLVIPKRPDTDHQLLVEIWDQLRIQWSQLGGRTLVDAVAELLKKEGIA